MEELDLHYIKGDPDFGIASEGEYIDDINVLIGRISEVKDTVKSISINFQDGIYEIPAVLGECKLIEKLNISHTGITEIPDFVFNLPNLTDLSCCCSYLKDFPADVFKAQKLERLHIRLNKDWNIPKKIPALPNLKILLIDMYTSCPMPENLNILNKLEQLFVATKYTEEGDVPDLPASLKNHSELREVSIIDPFHKYRKNYNLEKAAKILATCPKMEYFKLSGFAVGKGHQSLSLMKQIKKIDLGHLKIEGKIFNSISDLSNLEIIGIWGSDFRIAEIPDIFSNMKELQEFHFAGNMVTQLPPSFFNLTKLKVLEVGSTGIYSLDDKIGGMQSLESIHVYDSLLDKLPESVFSLPLLKSLNIEENMFNAEEVKQIKQKINALAEKGQKIQFTFDRQGHRQMVKKLRALNIKKTGLIDKMSVEAYASHCINAINESPYSIKYVNIEKLNDPKLYAKLCIAALRKKLTVIEHINAQALGKPLYFSICMETAKSPDIGIVFKYINGDFLTDGEYIQVCIEAALHNRHADFLVNLKTEAFQKRFSRDIFERISWVSILHNPKTALKKAK